MTKSPRRIKSVSLFLCLALLCHALPAFTGETTTDLTANTIADSKNQTPVSLDDQRPAVIALNDWASQRVLSWVIGRLLTQLKVPVVYQDIKVDDQWGAFRLGLLDVQIELWQGTNFKRYEQHVKKGFIVNAGKHIATAREEWWYPSYVKPMCPGLPDWKALLKCAKVFATEDSAGRGVYYSGQWNTKGGIRVRALNLDFNIKRLENDAALWQLLWQSMEERKPIIMINWTPNWTDTRLTGEFVEFPPYNDLCVTDASWGLNKTLPYDCGNPVSGWVKKVVSPRFKKNHSCAFKALQKVAFTTQMMSEAAALVITDKYTEQQAAIKWMEMFKTQWDEWLGDGC